MEFIFVKKGDNMKIAIVGAGKLGFKVTEALLGGDHSVTVIDTNENALNKLITQMDIMTVNANGKEVRVLESIGISTYDFLLACTNSDEQNIIIASFAKNSAARGLRQECATQSI